MRRNHVALALMVFLLLGFYACKSVETTSAMLHNQTKTYDKAIHFAKLGIEKNPMDAEAHFQLGISYSYTEKMDSAYYFFKRAAELDPKRETTIEDNIGSNWARHFNLGVSEYQSENLEGAAKEFVSATQADPRRIKGWLNLAMAYRVLAESDSTYEEQLFEVADTLMSKIEEGDPDYGKVLALAGRAMITRGDQARAVEIFERLLRDDPTNAEIIEAVGNDFLRKGDYEKAVEMFRMAARGYRQTDSESADLYFNMGVCYLRTDNYLSAAEAYQQVVALEPDNKTAHYSLLLAYYQGEFWDEVIMYGQEYTTKVAPEDPRGWQILGLTYSKKNMKELAEQAIGKYQELQQQ